MARFEDVQLFLGVVEAGSFRGAAKQLEVTSSTVSRGIQRLEQYLGAPLMLRDTRTIKLTDCGKAYLRHAKRAAANLAEGERVVTSLSNSTTGTLRLSCTSGLAQSCLQSIISRFLQDYPNIHVDLVLTPRFVNPLLDNIDVAVRVGKRLQDSSLRNRVLLRSPMIAAATPKIATMLKNGDPVPAVVFRRPGSKTELMPPVPHNTRLSADDYQITADAIRNGVGLGVVDEALVRADLKSGQLVQVLPNWRLGEVRYWAVYAASGRLPQGLRALLDALTEGMAAVGDA